MSLEFLGMVGVGSRRALLFNNPTLIGYPFPFIGAIVEVVFPATSSPTIVVDARLRARLGGFTSTNLTLLDAGGNAPWGAVP